MQEQCHRFDYVCSTFFKVYLLIGDKALCKSLFAKSAQQVPKAGLALLNVKFVPVWSGLASQLLIRLKNDLVWGFVVVALALKVSGS